MVISKYKKDDIQGINNLGSLLHNNFKLDLNQYSSCYALKDRDKLIGFITYSIIYERSEIIDVIVDNNYRNNGYGKQLILKVIEEARKNKCINITLEVSKSNSVAVNLYKSLGFEIVSDRKNYYNNSDAYLMIKYLG